MDVGLRTSLRTKHCCHEFTRGSYVPRRYVQPNKEEEEEEKEEEKEKEKEEGEGGGGEEGEINMILAEQARKQVIEVTSSETFLCLQLQSAIPCLVSSDPKFLNGNYFLFMKAEKVYEVLTFNCDLTRLVAFSCHESLKLYIFKRYVLFSVKEEVSPQRNP